jgi:hypothetical protein
MGKLDSLYILSLSAPFEPGALRFWNNWHDLKFPVGKPISAMKGRY